MSIFSQLAEKPWLNASDSTATLPAGPEPLQPPRRMALRFFLYVVGVLFFLLTVSYGGRMALEDWRPAPQIDLLWQNTLMLILASVAMQWALYSARRGRTDNVKIGLLAGAAFTVAFLTGQVLAWRQLGAMPTFDVTNPAIAFFYLITGLHVLHLLGGLIAWGRTADRVWHGHAFELAKIAQSVSLCTIYWHFLLAVWLILFGLLFSGNDTMGLLLALCGIK